VKLKHLTLRGFKSFADRTRLDFASGVNVVVGPNGSGKSNILDAIAWVMGTQATRSLRTEKMEDVVFAGTATRPPLPRAEVQLSFDNDDPDNPLALTEVTITRRLFRDGTSEYELNGVPCRLLDIQELLSDGGIGRHQHVLVGQGQVGDVLNARPEDHRVVIEEAAGITKHKSRRDRAVRRLERTDHDVERIQDILTEKRRALRPLKRQANAAARHDAVRDEAQALRLFLAGEEIRRIRGRLGTAALEREAALEARDTADAALGALRTSLDSLRSKAGTVGAELARDTAAAARLETVAERLSATASVARERRRAMEARAAGAGERHEDLAAEEDTLVEAIEAATRDEIETSDEADRRETALAALEDEERSLSEQIQLPAEGVVANLRGDLRALETAADRDATERAQLIARRDATDRRIADEEAEIESLNERIKHVDETTGQLQPRYEAAHAARERAQDDWEKCTDAVASARIDLAGSQARVEALEAALDGLVDQYARELAEEADGIVGPMVALLDVPADIAPAVDAALGGWRDAFVAGSGEALSAASRTVKGSGTGGVSFVTSPSASPAPAVDIAASLGVDALIDLLGPGADRALAATHLGDCVVVEGWQTGYRLVAEHPHLRAVTPEGDEITADGIRIAQPDGAGPAALEAARVAVEKSERELQRAASRLTTAQRAFDDAREAERESLELLEAAEAELAGFTEALAIADRARLASIGERDRLDSRLTAIDEATSGRAQRMEALRARLAEFEGEEAARQAAWEALNERRSIVAGERDAARRALEEVAARRASIIERRRLSEQRLETVRRDLAQLVLLPASAEDIARLERIESDAIRAYRSVEGHVERLRDRQRSLREHVGHAHEELAAAEEQRERSESARRIAEQSLHDLDVELAELRVRLEATLEATRRDADATEQQALDASAPDIAAIGDPHDRLRTLEADLRRMGPINPLAAAEYAQLAAEVDELDHQLDDLETSRSDLRGVIAALDETMAELFSKAFDEIAELYRENFALVFPGGTGSLGLTDPGDPMGTGVLVEAQPAGKKVGRLSLLSGGERSLAALAFLFAVFRARPSPFYVLDEVEAALDDANLHRFLRLVDTLRRDTQLVIITHQQQTMEAADVLYGVTMEPGESSQVLSKRMSGVGVSGSSVHGAGIEAR
jgi:chromosome segregation protein